MAQKEDIADYQEIRIIYREKLNYYETIIDRCSNSLFDPFRRLQTENHDP
jgi:hypothetical protein